MRAPSNKQKCERRSQPLNCILNGLDSWIICSHEQISVCANRSSANPDHSKHNPTAVNRSLHFCLFEDALIRS
ncbi:hypothetical protein RHGRI_008039 [Rhododendron griersonianum]|uniref:Uncharacterized protein n=1 Tax=Rhododendron griersonianum TaxID=479676 RepID=A0AAV6KYY6_9ERIC|nr:hypothetical protein RHGRI_008039 [Rhododendron griersonianum]